MADFESFPTIRAFYDQRGGGTHGECDFGVWWYSIESADGQRRGPFYRVSVVHDTGDVYALNQWSKEVQLLTTIAPSRSCSGIGKHLPSCCYETAEEIFAGWADGGSKPIEWARGRARGVIA